jgi:hypothetical protein
LGHYPVYDKDGKIDNSHGSDVTKTLTLSDKVETPINFTFEVGSNV